MSKKKARELCRQNNIDELEMSKDTNEIYTDMVVYLRVSNLTPLQQEQVRCDLINMIVDGEKRGETLEQIMGGDYKQVCNEIIASFPPKTRKDKLLETLAMGCLFIGILLLFEAAGQLIGNLITGKSLLWFEFDVAEVIYLTVFAVAAYLLVEIICKTALNKKPQPAREKNKVIEFLKLWLIMCVVFGLVFLLKIKLNFVLFSCSIIAVVVVALLLLGIYFLIDYKTEY